MYEIKTYSKDLQSDIVDFYRLVLPESGRELDLKKRDDTTIIRQRMYLW